MTTHLTFWLAATAVALASPPAFSQQTTGVPDGAGQLDIANPLKTTLAISAGRSF